MNPPSRYSLDKRTGLSAFERDRAFSLRCDAQLASAQYADNECYKPSFVAGHPDSPLHVRYYLQRVQLAEHIKPADVVYPLANAIGLLDKASSQSLFTAELKLRLLRTDRTVIDHEKHALAARTIFAAAGRSAEVAELDAILGDRKPSGDPWAP